MKKIYTLAVTSYLTSVIGFSEVYAQSSDSFALRKKSEGRKPSSEVIYRQSGVPAFEMVQKKGTQVYKVKDIPKLDIGEEKQLEAADFQVQIPEKRTLQLGELKRLNSPPIVPLQQFAVEPATRPKKIIQSTGEVLTPPVKDLAAVPTPVIEPAPLAVKNFVELNPDEYKMLQALVFLENQKKYDLAMSLFVELMEKPKYRTEAMYHYAETAYGLGLFSEFRQKMIQVIQETKDLTLKKMAAESLVKNIKSLESTDIGLIDPLVESFDIDIATNEHYLLKKAKFYANKGDLGQVESAVNLIQPGSPLYSDALLLKAIFNYRQGQVEAAITDLETSWPLIESDKKSQTRNLSALTLARLYFQKGDYKTAYKNYLKIDKSSTSWLQAMVESAWTQILAGDNEGAAGNMFSLHTDFFKKAYSPDTYIVRTVGYLNLCQFGDGVSVLNDLKKRYTPVKAKLDTFQKNNKNTEKYYDIVKNWLKNTDLQEVEGLPRAFIVELARHPSFTALQKQINNFEDENLKFNKITVDLIRKEKEVRLRMLQAKNELAVLKREKADPEKIAKFDRKFLAVGVEHMIVSRAREGIKKMRTDALARIEKEKVNLRQFAGKVIQSRFNEHVAVLTHLIDQNEVLSYEIYSGAGEHIRYQMAGGKGKEEVQKEQAANGRAPASLTPEESESYKWKFKGEVWEDEIGHYRSSLKNVCPADDLAQNAGGQ